MKTFHIICLFLCLTLMACQSSDETSVSPENSSPVTLAENRQETGTIEHVGNVDWYRYRTRQDNALVHIQCTNNTRRPDTELLVTVYEKNTDGNYKRLYADHAPENSVLPTNIQMSLYMEVNKDLFIAVRDYMDDEASVYPYYIKISETERVSNSASFESAIPIEIDSPNGCINASIESIGNVDHYRFSVPNKGVYAIQLNPQSFQNTTSVVFSLDIYATDGRLIIRHRPFHNYSTCLPLLLDSGDYRLVISDSGQDDADPSASCQVCIQSRLEMELSSNDTLSTATDLGEISSGTITVDGRLAYRNDQDCYSIRLLSTSNQDLPVIQLEFMSLSNHQGTYQLDYYDTDQLVLSHEYTPGITPYETFINSRTDENMFCVHPVTTDQCDAMAYTAQLTLKWVDDPDEQIEKQDPFTGEWSQGNNTITTAHSIEVTALTSTVIGKIAYQGDEDWYALSVNHQQSGVMNIFFETQLPGDVEYRLSMIEDSIVTRRLSTQDAGEPTFLKTSLWLPSSESITPKSFFLRICDDLGNDADPQIPYIFKTYFTPVPSFIAPVESPLTTLYHHEDSENDAHMVSLTVYDKTTQSFHVDTTSLRADHPEVVTQVDMETVTIKYPWIGGYIDYQGDQDWFFIPLNQLDIDALGVDNSFATAEWYYDISIELISPGSSVEYVWKFFRDKTGNKNLNDTHNTTNGYFASAGDTDLQTNPVHILIPEDNQHFWVGNLWKGDYYLCMTDFNNVTGNKPDDDWGYDAPYYFQVTLVYHPGKSSPE
ncbi:MAG: hypothetical protein HQK75_20550 [Candidatus Magnetomorum sp.]|nr:hypothetical protein [Candidatus Magnetomorum sp.]